MEKVLLIQDTISHYRVPVYNILAQQYELHAICSYGDIPPNAKFEVRTIPTHNIWKFTLHSESLYKTAQQYDAVVGLFAPTWLSISSLAIRSGRKYKFICWGIGVPASYSVRYDDSVKSTKPTEWMIKKSDAVIFYSDYPVDKYSGMGFDKRKMFVAHNTVEVLPTSNLDSGNKNSILFIGSLYKAKGIMTLLESYKRLFAQKQNKTPLLRVVGSGNEFQAIIDWVKENKLSDHVRLEGAVYDEKMLKGFFEDALVCISPGQAGLSVQKSMGYGVPFVTSKNAYTGGERFDIKHGDNGVLYDEDAELLTILSDVCENKDKYIEMGKSAYEFYHKYRTIEIMAKGAEDAISYALHKR